MRSCAWRVGFCGQVKGARARATRRRCSRRSLPSRRAAFALRVRTRPTRPGRWSAPKERAAWTWRGSSTPWAPCLGAWRSRAEPRAGAFPGRGAGRCCGAGARRGSWTGGPRSASPRSVARRAERIASCSPRRRAGGGCAGRPRAPSAGSPSRAPSSRTRTSTMWADCSTSAGRSTWATRRSPPTRSPPSRRGSPRSPCPSPGRTGLSCCGIAGGSRSGTIRSWWCRRRQLRAALPGLRLVPAHDRRAWVEAFGAPVAP